MYGYVTPDKPYMAFKDFGLFRAFYCGTCKRINKLYGECARMATNYDIVFLEVFVFSIFKIRPEFDRAGCILNPFRKKDYVKPSQLFDRLLAFNALLAYYNLDDDVIDGEGLKKLVPKRLLAKSRRRAKKAFPEADKIICDCYADLRRLEEVNCASADRAADPFGRMMKGCVAAILGDKTCVDAEELVYNLARYIYLIDAVDDLTKDFKKKHYNPYLAAYGDFTDRETFWSAHGEEIAGGIHASINRCIECYNRLGLTEAKDLLDNIVYRGLRRKAAAVFNCDKKIVKEKL